MPNIFYAKEVYKTYRDHNDNKHFVRLKGLYVTGKFKPPFYMDPLLLVTNLDTTNAIVYHMTEHDDQIKSDDMLACIQNKFILHGDYVKMTIAKPNVKSDDMLACIQNKFILHGDYVKFTRGSDETKGGDGSNGSGDMLACIQSSMLSISEPYLKLSQQYGSNYPGECLLMINELTTIAAVIEN